MTEETIYVALLGEGLDVRRPVRARRLSGDRYLIVEQDYDRDIETWAYEPGTVVECRRERRNDRELTFAVRAVDQKRTDAPMERRLVWKGNMRLSLVSCPVSLYAATTRSALRPDELRAKSISIDSFVEEQTIDPIYLDYPYYLVPRGLVAEETFFVIFKAMRRKGVVALSQISFQQADRKIALFAGRKVLRVHVLRNRDEILEEDLLAREYGVPAVEEEMLELAGKLVDQKRGKFIPLEDPFEARQETALREGIHSGKVINLMEALRKSIKDKSTAIAQNNRRTGGKG